MKGQRGNDTEKDRDIETETQRPRKRYTAIHNVIGRDIENATKKEYIAETMTYSKYILV